MTEQEIKEIGASIAESVKAGVVEGVKAAVAEMKPPPAEHDTSKSKATFDPDKKVEVTREEEPDAAKNFDGYLQFVKDTMGLDVTKYMDPEDAKWKTAKMRNRKFRSLVHDFVLGSILPAKELMANPKIMQNYDMAAKAMTLTTTGGGYLVPAELASEVVYTMGDYTAINDFCRRVPMTSATENWPTVTSGPTSYWPGTNTAITDTAPAVGQAPLVAKPHGTLVYLPRQLAMSTRIDVTRLVVDLSAEALGIGRENAVVAGDGSDKPYGFTNAHWSSIASVSMASSALAYVDLVSLMFSVARKYRAQGVWGLSSAALKLVTALSDDNDRPIWSAPVTGLPGTILGKPYFELDSIPDDEGSSPNYTTRIYFGASKNILLGEQEGMVIESSTEAGDTFAKHQLAIKVIEFIDSYVANQSALKYLTGVI